MDFTEEQIRNILDVKEQLIQKIQKHREEIENLEKNLMILDSILKKSSFTKASVLSKSPKTESAIPITKGSDGPVIANAYVTPEQVSIVLNTDIGLNVETPPFKSFFLDRIIGEMKKKDISEVEMGRIQNESVIDCIVNKNGANISEIIIKNYRQKERVNEIINTAGWSLSRMIENSSR
jgi:hypothetical protein